MFFFFFFFFLHARSRMCSFVLVTLELHRRVLRGARRQRVRYGTGFSVGEILARAGSILSENTLDTCLLTARILHFLENAWNFSAFVRFQFNIASDIAVCRNRRKPCSPMEHTVSRYGTFNDDRSSNIFINFHFKATQRKIQFSIRKFLRLKETILIDEVKMNAKAGCEVNYIRLICSFLAPG